MNSLSPPCFAFHYSRTEAFWTRLSALALGGTLVATGALAQLPPEVRTISEVKKSNYVSTASVMRREMPTDPRERSFFLNEEAVRLIVQGKKTEGREKLEESLRNNSENTTAMYNLAGVQLSEGETAAAILTMKRAVELDPSDLSFLNRLAEAHFAGNDVDAAIATYRKIVSVDAKYEEALFRLGTLLAAQKKWDQAEDALRQASEFMVDDTRVLSNLGSVYIVQKKYREAASVLEKVYTDEQSAENTLALAIAYEGLDNDKRALELFRQARELGSQDPNLEKHIQTLEQDMASKTAP